MNKTVGRHPKTNPKLEKQATTSNDKKKHTKTNKQTKKQGTPSNTSKTSKNNERIPNTSKNTQTHTKTRIS